MKHFLILLSKMWPAEPFLLHTAARGHFFPLNAAREWF